MNSWHPGVQDIASYEPCRVPFDQGSKCCSKFRDFFFKISTTALVIYKKNLLVVAIFCPRYWNLTDDIFSQYANRTPVK